MLSVAGWKLWAAAALAAAALVWWAWSGYVAGVREDARRDLAIAAHEAAAAERARARDVANDVRKLPDDALWDRIRGPRPATGPQ